ncbi:RIC3 domain-containing protein [Trichonephila clavata]|uniref:RIC3 domain-containing protein n=1 Tax=Trichonephila clavata TaxID=2740835 RepID=A0A8X6HXA3_TRICU|nr:RIC3 domain-containing protein [Trichonephila clavata]
MSEISVETSSKRSLTVLAVVVACFAILWPKIFYPMIISILFPSDEEENQDEIRKLDFHDMLHPQMREAMGEARPLEKTIKEGNKALFHPSLRYTAKPQSKGAGAVNLVIPVYTIAIILFFIYSLFKTFLKKNQESCHLYNVKQQKAACPLNCTEMEDSLNKRKDNSQERKAQRALEQYGKDKVLTALKTIILEMEDFKGTASEEDNKQDVIGNSGGNYCRTSCNLSILEKFLMLIMRKNFKQIYIFDFFPFKL